MFAYGRSHRDAQHLIYNFNVPRSKFISDDFRRKFLIAGAELITGTVNSDVTIRFEPNQRPAEFVDPRVFKSYIFDFGLGIAQNFPVPLVRSAAGRFF